MLLNPIPFSPALICRLFVLSAEKSISNNFHLLGPLLAPVFSPTCSLRHLFQAQQEGRYWQAVSARRKIPAGGTQGEVTEVQEHESFVVQGNQKKG